MRRARQPAAPDLKPQTIAILLDGWAAEAPEPSPHGFGAGLLELFDDASLVGLWRAHETFLRATARRWKWEPRFRGADGRLRYYAEHLAAGNTA